MGRRLSSFRTLLLAVAVLALAMLVLGAPATIAELPQPQSPSALIGPYVQNVSTDAATICWATARGKVSSGSTGGESKNGREYDHHAVTLRDLKPGTTYTYDVLGDGTGAGKATFTTFPQGEQPFTFIVISDTQGKQEVHRRVVKRIIAEKPDLVFNVGDLTDNGWQMPLWETFFRISGDLMRTVPYYPALGNHEKDSQLYFDFFSLPGNERYYSFNRPPAHLVVLDVPGPLPAPTNQPMSKEEWARFMQYRDQYWQQQLEWLKNDLAGAGDFKYVFLFFHYPPFSVRASCQEEAAEMRKRLGTVLYDHHVSAVFNGHDHHYHRAVAEGVQFVDAGVAAGAPRPIETLQPQTVKYAQVVSYVRVEVGLERARLRVTDVDGRTVDQFEVSPRKVAAAVR